MNTFELVLFGMTGFGSAVLIVQFVYGDWEENR